MVRKSASKNPTSFGLSTHRHLEKAPHLVQNSKCTSQHAATRKSCAWLRFAVCRATFLAHSHVRTRALQKCTQGTIIIFEQSRTKGRIDASTAQDETLSRTKKSFTLFSLFSFARFATSWVPRPIQRSITSRIHAIACVVAMFFVVFCIFFSMAVMVKRPRYGEPQASDCHM